MISVAAWNPEILRRINLRLFTAPEHQYDLLLEGLQPEAATLRRIKNLKRGPIRSVLRAIPDPYPATPEGYRDWWIRWMAVCAGTQLWPDGNHRTALLMAQEVAFANGWTMEWNLADVDAMRRGSKQIIQERHAKPPRPEPEEFAAGEHPLVQHYTLFRDRFELKNL